MIEVECGHGLVSFHLDLLVLVEGDISFFSLPVVFDYPEFYFV